MNLIQELGIDYFADRFRNCFFRGPEGESMVVAPHHQTRGCITATKIVGEITAHTTEVVALPYDFFSSLSVFAVPPLGWRSAAGGRYLTFLRRNNRSYRRGVSADNVIQEPSPLTRYLFDTNNLSASYYQQPVVVGALVIKPEFVELRPGLELLKAGKILSFCVTPNLAVMPDVEERQAIYFNTRRAGTVEADGSITCTNQPILSVIEAHL